MTVPSELVNRTCDRGISGSDKGCQDLLLLTVVRRLGDSGPTIFGLEGASTVKNA